MTEAFYTTDLGSAYCADSLEFMRGLESKSIDLVITSPPFALRTKKAYGNVAADEYIEWFLPFAHEVHRILQPRGSLVLDIGGAWVKGKPTRSLYHFELLLELCKPYGPFHLAQEFYWYNTAKMPSPAQWVTIERIRVKDAVNPIWWLSRGTRPNASNRRVLKPYSKSMKRLLKKGYNKGRRPSGHVVSDKWGKKQAGAIPPNLIKAANTRSTDGYLDGCRERELEVHPARFVEEVPEFFIKFLTIKNHVVLDPFAGSNLVGKVAERLGRRWISVEINPEYVVGSAYRFEGLGDKVFQEHWGSLEE